MCNRMGCNRKPTHGVKFQLTPVGGDEEFAIYSSLRLCHRHAVEADVGMISPEMRDGAEEAYGCKIDWGNARRCTIRLDSTEWAEWEHQMALQKGQRDS